MDKLEVRMPEVRKTAVRVSTVDEFGQAQPWNVKTERFEERIEPVEGDFFALYVTPEGTPVSPENALDVMLAGGTLVTEWHEAHATLQALVKAARLSVAEQVRHMRPLDAAMFVECRKREAAAIDMLGLGMLDVALGNAGAFFTSSQLATLYGVDVQTIHAWSGQKLPAAIYKNADGGLVFNAAPILNQLRNAGPAKPPTVSPKPAAPKTKPRPKVASSK